MDDDAFRGEVIFTFDGDAAGQKAALRAFGDDQKFVTQTFVAVEPNGMDPCELRQEKGDEALRDLIARRIPLFEFAIRTELKKHDLQTAEGRVNALTATAPIVAAIRDKSLRPEYVRNLAGWLGMEMESVSTQVLQSVTKSQPQSAPQSPSDDWRPNPIEPTLVLEREVLKAKLQMPELVLNWSELPQNAFSHPAYVAMRTAIDQGAKSIDDFQDEKLKNLFTELSVEGIRSDRELSSAYVQSILARLHELAISRTVAEIKSKLQRLNPVENEKEYNESFTELVSLEAKRRELRESALGSI
jgi:DNA primase